MIYEKLERKFLRSTAKFEFNNTQYGFMGLLVLLVISLGVTILYFYQVNWKLSFRLFVILIISIVLIILMMLFIYPYYFFRKQLKKSKNTSLKNRFSYYNLRQLLWYSSINALVEFLYVEQIVQKNKIEMMIKHYESMKIIRSKFAFPFLVALSLIFSVISSYYSLPIEKAYESLLVMTIIAFDFLLLYGVLRLSNFLDRFIFKTNDKYNYILDLLTDIYFTRFNKNYLLKNAPEKD